MAGLPTTSAGTRVLIKTLDESFEVDVGPEQTVASLRAVLLRHHQPRGRGSPTISESKSSSASATSLRKVRLIYQGRLLQDADAVKSVVPNGSVVHCVVSQVSANAAIENDPAGVTVPVDLDTLVAEDRRLAERLQRQGRDVQTQRRDQAQHQEVPGVEGQGHRRGRRAGRESGARRGSAAAGGGRSAGRNRERDGERGRAAAGTGADSVDANPVGNFLLYFALGVMFGFVTLLFSHRLSRRQATGLLCGVMCNLVVTIVHQTRATHEEADLRAALRRSETEQLDRYGNVLSTTVAVATPSLRGAVAQLHPPPAGDAN